MIKRSFLKKAIFSSSHPFSGFLPPYQPQPVQQRQQHQLQQQHESNDTGYGSPATVKQEQSDVEQYSRKVFVGGLPIDVTESEIHDTFSKFGNVLVDWPRRADSSVKEPRSGNLHKFLSAPR